MQSWLAQALELRQQASAVLPAGSTGDPHSVYQALMHLRGYLDRMETLLSYATGMTGSARRYARALADQADDAYDQAMVRQRRIGRQEEFISARERHADASLAAFQQQRAARQAQALRDEAEEITDRIRSAYRWADEARRDMRAALGHLAWESHLER